MQDAANNSNLNSPQLNEEEVTQLAEELKQQLRQGQVPLADTELIELMVAGLGDPRWVLRLTFSESLGAVGSAAVPQLCRALRQHKNVTVRRAAAKTLKLIGEPSALPSLIEALLNDSDPVVQGSAVGAMAALGACAVESLVGVLTNPDSTGMQLGLASWGLAYVGARAPEALREAAQSPHGEVRAAAIAALGEQIQSQADQKACELVIAALKDPISDVRAEATTLLGKLNNPEWAIPYLIPMLDDNEAQVRKNAALSLMKLGDQNALTKLINQEAVELDSGVKMVLKLAIKQLS